MLFFEALATRSDVTTEMLICWSSMNDLLCLSRSMQFHGWVSWVVFFVVASSDFESPQSHPSVTCSPELQDRKMPKSLIMKFEDPVTKCCQIDLETRFRYTTCPYCGKAKVGCILPLCGLSFQLLCFLDGCKQRSATTTRLSFIVHLTLSFRSCLKELKVNKLSHDRI